MCTFIKIKSHIWRIFTTCARIWCETGWDSTSAVPESLPCLGNELYFKHSPAGLSSSISEPRAGGGCPGGFTFKLCRFVEKTPVSLLGCWCERRSWGQGQAWCSWWTWDAPPSAAAAPVHQFPATGTGRRDPRTLRGRRIKAQVDKNAKVENYGTLTLMHTVVHALAPNTDIYITNKSIRFEMETDELQINVWH